MKNIILFLLFILLLQSCAQDYITVQEQNIKNIIAEDYPRIDGSTSSLPILQEIYKSIHAYELINGQATWSELPQEASKTIDSYKMLISGELDLIIVPYPSEEIQSLIVEKNIELDYIPICLEALIFIVNKEANVKNITTEELKKIYIDASVDNWSQIGGINNKIGALVRNQDSGSHSLMEKFILQGEEMNEEINEYNTIITMFAMVEEVENYINNNNVDSYKNPLPLGYTVYYYFKNNKKTQNWDNIEILNINGVEPNNQTIASKEYPYSTCYYAVIKKDTPIDATPRKLISWLLSKESQELFKRAGFGTIK